MPVQLTQPIAHGRRRQEALLRQAGAFADLDADAAARLHRGEAGFVGGVVAGEHRVPADEGRRGEEGIDRTALADERRLDLGHALAVQQRQARRRVDDPPEEMPGERQTEVIREEAPDCAEAQRADLETTQSSLEDIFVSLVKAP